MLYLSNMRQLLREAQDTLAQVGENCRPMPDGMLTLGDNGEFRPFTQAERDADQRRNEATIASYRATVDHYQKVVDDEVARLGAESAPS